MVRGMLTEGLLLEEEKDGVKQFEEFGEVVELVQVRRIRAS
jgi:hypothetical protein